MNFKIQRFQSGHKYYTEKIISQNGINYCSVFGQCVDENGKFIDYTLERFDTLIAEGIYTYDLYFSPTNKLTVPRLTSIGGIDISQRELEHHPACYAYNLKGCCAHGQDIALGVPMLLHSQDAIRNLIKLIAGQTGTITYEKFIN